MPNRKMFLNLPVTNLDKTVDFFTQLGFEFNPQFTDENGTCMLVGEDAYVMLLVEDFFKTFIKKEIADSTTHAESIFAVSVGSREQVDDLADKALAAGGQPSNEPQDHGFMYARSFQDLDGHLWEVFHMDPEAVPQP